MMSNELTPTSSPNPDFTIADDFAGRTGLVNSEGRFNASSYSEKAFTQSPVGKRDADCVMLDYRPIRPDEYETVRQFLSENGWAHRVSDAARFATMLDNTSRTVVAWEDERVVGFARALCDGVSNGYLSMMAVAENRRGQGIGRELVERLMGDDSNITWVVRAGRGSEDFWRKMGFAVSETAMERTRR